MDNGFKMLGDEALLKEFQWAKEHIRDEDVPEAAADELEKILERIGIERAGTK